MTTDKKHICVSTFVNICITVVSVKEGKELYAAMKWNSLFERDDDTLLLPAARLDVSCYLE